MTTTTSPTSTLLFAGDKKSFFMTKLHLLNGAIDIVLNCEPLGALGLILSPIDYDLFYRSRFGIQNSDQIFEFAAPVFPGKRPEPLLGTTTRDAVSVFNMMVGVYDDSLKKFNNFLVAKSALKIFILQSLTVDVKNSIQHPLNGFTLMSEKDIYNALILKYGTSSLAELNQIHISLSKSYSITETFDQFVYRHLNGHLFCEQANAPFSMTLKVTMARESLWSCHLFDRIIQLYFDTHHDLASISFSSFIEFIRYDIEEQELSRKSIPFKASKAVATSEIAASVTSDVNKKLMKKPLQLTKDERKLVNVFYCYTHGPLCSHSSADCKHPGEGHKANATNEARLGGRDTKWVRSTDN